jgi:hypothetical protein
MKKIGIIIILVLASINFLNVSAADPSTTRGNAGAAAGRAVGTPLLSPPLGNGTAGGTDLKTIFMNVLDVAQTIMIMVTTLYLIYSGFMFVTAKGDPSRLKKAQDSLLWGLIGAALILSAEVLAYGIGDTVKEVFKGQ